MYRLLLLATADKRSRYRIKKELMSGLGHSGASAEALLAKLPAVVAQNEQVAELALLQQTLEDLGGQVQINPPGESYCGYHIAQKITDQCSRCQEPCCAVCGGGGLENKKLCQGCVDRATKWLRFKRRRQTVAFFILLIVLVVAWQIRQADEQKLVWDRPYSVALISVIKAGEKTIPQAISKSAQVEIVQQLEAWFAAEIQRVRGTTERPFRFEFLDATTTNTSVPTLPTEADGWWQRYQQTKSFIQFFQNQLPAEATSNFDIKLYLYIYPTDEALGYARQHSVGTTRGRFGVVFIPYGKQGFGETVTTIAHETLHTVGAKDKYDENHYTIYPDGYFQSEIRYPQLYGEIMAMAIPLGVGKEKHLQDIKLARIGEKTAQEIGWRPTRR
jgi:predicted Zn-ribbon and HTH transcriptional regulator